ncbi:MAG: phosphotransferase [Pirellulales bacterium]|nr:phosphotransferase [Pirellulales bacterium]
MIERRLISGRPVYVKQHLLAAEDGPHEFIRTQVEREIEVLAAIASLPGITRHLGAMKVVESDPAKAEIVTEEVPGEPLQSVLCSRRTVTFHGTCIRALYLAGKWLRVFQTLPVSPQIRVSRPGNPGDLVAHCDLRLRKLTEVGYHWPSSTSRPMILRWLREQIESTPREQLDEVCCHGDYGPYNMLWDGTTLTPIDFATCSTDLPLADVTYLIHRIEMLPIQFPWRCWPVALWRRACLRGYGMPSAMDLPIYHVFMVRHLLSRLKKLVESTPNGRLQRWHNAWLRGRVRSRLSETIGECQTKC